MPNMEDLTARMGVPEEKPEDQDCVNSHIKTLAERLGEAFGVVRRQNKINRMGQRFNLTKILNW
jgi:hypothetical protein